MYAWQLDIFQYNCYIFGINFTKFLVQTHLVSPSMPSRVPQMAWLSGNLEHYLTVSFGEEVYNQNV